MKIYIRVVAIMLLLTSTLVAYGKKSDDGLTGKERRELKREAREEARIEKKAERKGLEVAPQEDILVEVPELDPSFLVDESKVAPLLESEVESEAPIVEEQVVEAQVIEPIAEPIAEPQKSQPTPQSSRAVEVVESKEIEEDSDSSAGLWLILALLLFGLIGSILKNRCPKCGKLWAMHTTSVTHLGESSRYYDKATKKQIVENRVARSRECKYCGHRDVVESTERSK